MDIIETLEPAAFTEYLKTYSNTICGRHPISVLLQVKLKTINQYFGLLYSLIKLFTYLTTIFKTFC